MSVLAIRPKVYFDWNDNGSFADANEDVSGEIYAVSWSRGRSNVNDDFGMGTATVILVNTSGIYSPFDTGSAIYPNMVPGIPAKIEFTHNSITYGVFYGRLASVEQLRSPDGAPLVVMELEDEFGRMGRSRYRSSQVLATAFGDGPTNALALALTDAGILEDYGYNAADMTMEVSLASFGLIGFWAHETTHLAAAKLAAHQELGGAFFMAADGKPTFYNRNHNSEASIHATFTGVQALDLSMRQSDYYDTVAFKRAGFDIDADTGDLFTLFPTGRAFAEGSTDPQNTFGGGYVGGGNTVTQPVADTDWTFNALKDGSGEDVTNKHTLSTWTNYGAGFEATFNNASGAISYNQSFRVRGLAVRATSDNREVVEVDAAAPVANQALRDEFAFNDDEASIRGYALFKLYAGTAFYPRRLKTRHIPRTDAEAVTILGFELLKKLTITNTTGLYPSQINEDFFIQSIRGRAILGGLVEVDCVLWHKIASLGNFFRISGATNYSTIAGDADTAGDRVRF